ncbi:hypothetical protein HanHA89_Chr14g0585341 [Helianthus annuus]|nr:hypothetical protein HanHA89_Chr14g0585341 [Helianthus annuus]
MSVNRTTRYSLAVLQGKTRVPFHCSINSRPNKIVCLCIIVSLFTFFFIEGVCNYLFNLKNTFWQNNLFSYNLSKSNSKNVFG